MTRIVVTNFPESAEREFDVERANLGTQYSKFS